MTRKRSRIWAHVNDLGNFYAVCNYCSQKLAYRSSVNNLKKHLLRMHPTVDLSIPIDVPPKLRLSTPTPVDENSASGSEEEAFVVLAASPQPTHGEDPTIPATDTLQEKKNSTDDLSNFIKIKNIVTRKVDSEFVNIKNNAMRNVEREFINVKNHAPRNVQSEFVNMKHSVKRNVEVKDESDAFDIYGAYVAAELRSVDNDRAVTQAKYRINNVLYELKMGGYDT